MESAQLSWFGHVMKWEMIGVPERPWKMEHRGRDPKEDLDIV